MKKKAVGAIALAGLVALQMPMVALAEVDSYIVDSSVTDSEKGITVDGDTITVSKEINYNGVYAVYVEEKNVVLKENVKNSYPTFSATIVTKGESEVLAEKDVTNNTGGNSAALAQDSSKIIIEGNAVTNNGTGPVILTCKNSTCEGTVIVNGNVTHNGEGKGIRFFDGGTVIVGGDVNANNGIEFKLQQNSEQQDNMIVAVNGELNVTDTAIITGANVDSEKIQIYIYGITADKIVAEDSKIAATDINYIIHGNDGKADYSNISAITGNTVAQTIEIGGDKYYSSKQGTVSVTLNDGYELSTGATIVSVNGNTYVVNVPEGGHVTLAAVKKAIQQAEERKASFTGSAENAVTNGQWNMGPGGYWTYRTDGIFKNTWGNITLENGRTGWFWFDKNGIMATGWQEIDGKWYYFNEAHDGSYGMLLVGTTTPDGKKVGADGALIQ